MRCASGRAHLDVAFYCPLSVSQADIMEPAEMALVRPIGLHGRQPQVQIVFRGFGPIDS